MIKKCILTLIIILATQVSFAIGAEKSVSTNEDFDELTIDLLDPSMKVTQLAVNFNVVISQMEAFSDFIRATDKFNQCNVRNGGLGRSRFARRSI